MTKLLAPAATPSRTGPTKERGLAPTTAMERGRRIVARSKADTFERAAQGAARCYRPTPEAVESGAMGLDARSNARAILPALPPQAHRLAATEATHSSWPPRSASPPASSR